MKLLLDTNAYSALRTGNSVVIDRIRRSEHLYLPMIVIGELLYGFGLGSRNLENKTQLESFLAERHVSLAAVDYEVCEVYARIAGPLRLRGKPIPSNDLWIASIALRNNFSLLTRDKHFVPVEGLNVIDW